MRSSTGCAGQKRYRWIIFFLLLPLAVSAATTCSPEPLTCPRGQQLYAIPKSDVCPAAGYTCGPRAVAPLVKPAPKSVTAPAAKTAANTPALPASSSLTLGARGTTVLTIQKQLITLGFLGADSATGFFGPLTREAVRNFQRLNDVVASGTEVTTGYGAAGPKTRAALEKAIATLAGVRSIASVATTAPYTPTSPSFTTANTVVPSVPLPSYSATPQPQVIPAVGPSSQPASCAFGGQAIPDGAFITAYLASSGTCQSGLRKCRNGTLSGSFFYPSCSPTAAIIATPTITAPPATAPVCAPLAAQTQSLSCATGQTGSITQSRTSTCPSGAATPTWGAWVTTTNTCTAPVPSNQSCSAPNGQNIPNGTSITAYRATTVSATAQCESELRTCSNGILSGSFTAASCAVSAAACSPLPSQSQTLTCPAGQTGSITQSRTSVCATGATTPSWGTWTTTANSCASPAPTVTLAPIPTAQVKDIMTFQIGGWSELPRLGPPRDTDWPLEGGKPAYLARTDASLAHQMDLIKALGDHVVIAPLLMTDSDSAASGYQACWNGTPSDDGLSCSGTWRYPFAMYDAMRTAARAKGVRYAPEFSIMNYDGVRGAQVLPKLQQMITWWRTTLPDAYAAKDSQGRYYAVLDSLPDQLGMTEAQKIAALDWMKSQSDIVWIDNFLSAAPNPSNYSSNVYFSTWGPDAAKDNLNSLLGNRFLWWFQANDAVVSYAEASDPAHKIPEATRRKWLNISPYDPAKYPVMISQWNEYAEYLLFEPSQRSGTANYDYLKWMLGQQI